MKKTTYRRYAFAVFTLSVLLSFLTACKSPEEETQDGTCGGTGGGTTTERTWCTITYNTYGGAPVASAQGWSGEDHIDITPVSKQPGLIFGYWCSDAACANKAPANTKITQNVTLYAKWIGFKSIAASGTHSLALDEYGDVWSWGDNSKGQLGTGNNTSRAAPGKVSFPGPRPKSSRCTPRGFLLHSHVILWR
jgi:hypothetical protein